MNSRQSLLMVLTVLSVLSVLSVTNFVSCALPARRNSGTPMNSSSETSDLTWSVAQNRKARLSQISYDLKVDLSDAKNLDNKSFSAELALKFNLAAERETKLEDLSLDFFEGSIQKLVLNGAEVSVSDSSGGFSPKKKYRIELPGSLLKVGSNIVSISYRQEYSTTGQGLHRFSDPEDKRVYLYSQFESFDANRFLPCFDQPDLRSALKLSVIAPADWTVISAGAAIAAEPYKSTLAKNTNLTLTSFEPTKEISTYLFSLHAGPYATFRDVYTRADKSTVPLRLFSRQSLKKYVRPTDWFLFTKQALSFYEQYFATPYPFTKLDQIIAPEFNMGGMENAAAIVYTEWMLPRSIPTRKMRRGLAGLQLHEIAHMWFGDLVTMKWWNDLWLNESFATFMSSKAMAEGTEFKEGWQTFAASVKNGAYQQDVMVTTHPIEAPVNTVKEAEATFDGITYNKGASVLKQLEFYMTPDSFREGIRHYFQTHSWQNTNLSDFIGALQTKTTKDLSVWADRWLRQSGVDSVATRWKCEQNQLKEIEVEFKSGGGSKFRPQSFEIGLFNSTKGTNGKTHLTQTVRVDFETPRTQKVTGSWKCPELVYPNTNDRAYIHVRLDGQSLAYLKGRLFSVSDLLVRSLLWNDLWRMVRDTDMSLSDYVSMVENNFAAENDEVIAQQIVNTISRGKNSILYYWPNSTKSDRDARFSFLQTMERDYARRIRRASSGSDEQKFWYDNFAALVESPEAVNQLYSWYQKGSVPGSKGPSQFKLDQDRMWGIAQIMSRFQHPRAQSVVETLRAQDRSDRGLKQALATDAIRPELGVKKKWIGEFIEANAGSAPVRSLQEMSTILWSMFPNEQQSLKLNFARDFYEYLQKNRKSEDLLRVETIVGALMPLTCEASESKQLKSEMDRYADLNPVLRKNLMMSIDEDERCQRIRAKSK